MRNVPTYLGIILLMGALMLSSWALAGPIPEPTPNLPDMESIAYRAKKTPTIDGDLSDWKNAAFRFIGEQKDVYRGNWGGRDDLSYVWSVMWDENAFYFAAAIWDDVYQELTNANEPWTGDCLFLYIDANVDGTIDNKPCFFLLGGQPTVFAAAGGVQPGDVELAIVMEPQLGEAGRILEVAIPLGSMKDMSPIEGGEFRMMPGYEEGTQGPESGKFIDWDGLNPDDAANLRKVTFGGLIDNSGPKSLVDSPSPADGALHSDTWVTLSWRPGDFAVSHDVYLGDDFDVVENATRDSDVFRANQTATFYVAGFPGFAYPDGLVPGTTYYWRIDEVNAPPDETVYKGNVWSFSIPPKTAYNPVPADGAGLAETTVTLSWTAGFGAKLHTVYFGDYFDTVANATVGTPTGTAMFNPGPLESEKVYYWRVDEFDGIGTFKGDVWAFATPGAVGNPQPANGAADVSMATVLSWTAADNAMSHEMYFGLDRDIVSSADTASPEYKGSKALGTESYDPGLLEPDTTYYWRVDEVYAGNTVKGPVWTFTVGNHLLVDDFESYTDNEAEGEAIWQTWIDGFGVADNGAQVGYLMPPYAEQTIIHGGSQSMPLLYANEAGVTNSEGSMILTAPRDWTQAGVVNLSLWFRGKSDNAVEPLYVAISNPTGAPAVMACEDQNAARAFIWKQWVIPLQDFADQGINLGNVDKIAIGVGSKAGAATGGSGTMYIDDIRLYRP
jgi:hypothetical protein